MTFLNPQTGQPDYMPSDRYCFLQTYTIKNIDPAKQSLQNVAFYQMLHSHGANEPLPVVCSTYSTVFATDPLQNYVPRNPVHQAGNFRYDITQWNDIYAIDHSRSHADFVGFGSTQEPDWVDNGTFRGHSDRPEPGTHTRIEDRNLNNEASIYNDEAAGAMGWDLGTLDPNETASITVAYLFGPTQEIPSPIALTKTDDIDPQDCVGPGDEITYTICWNHLGLTDANNVVLIDYLPKGVTYPVSYWMNPDWTIGSSDPNFHEEENYYRWDLGTIPAGSSGCVELTVTVTERVEPGMPITNRVRLATGNLGVSEAGHDTLICCWDTGGIIYVDPSATGYNTGVSWSNAYPDLQKAIARAQAGCWASAEIRVVQGEYDPGREAGTTFAIPDNVSVYGGYRGGPVDPNDRRPKVYKTILTGLGDSATRNETVVTMGNNSLLDGATVREASDSGQGILAEGVTFTVSNCVIEDNQQFGIRGNACNATIQWCIIRENAYHGIFQDGTGNSIAIENCHILDNHYNGMYLKNTLSSILKNNTVCRNGSSGTIYFGIRIENPDAVPVIRNNTIAYNRNAGLSYVDNDANYVHTPDIQNCILWYNNQTGNGAQFAGHRAPTYYSCIYDPNDPACTSTTLDANFNFTHKPDFAFNNEPNNVHLAANSFCINKGNPNLTYPDQLDIDGEDRVMGSYVDVGADEVNPECDEVYHPLDWNADGVVNLVEFYDFSVAWLTCDPNRPGGTSGYDPNDLLRWNPRCDLDQDYDVDLTDLLIFVEDDPQNWLWIACWRLDLQAEQLEQMMMSMAPVGGTLTQSLSVSTARIEKSTTIVPEITIQEQIIDLKDTIQFLERLWLDDPSIQQDIDPDEWQQFMQKVYDSFNELKTINTKLLDVSEESQ